MKTDRPLRTSRDIADRAKFLIGERLPLFDYPPTFEQQIVWLATKLGRHIHETRKDSRRPITLIDANELALRSTCAEVAIKLACERLDMPTKWMSETTLDKGPFDLVIAQKLRVDVKCGEVGNTVTVTQLERAALADTHPDVYHIRCDWSDDYTITPTHVYHAAPLPWKKGLNDTDETPKHLRSYLDQAKRHPP